MKKKRKNKEISTQPRTNTNIVMIREKQQREINCI